MQIQTQDFNLRHKKYLGYLKENTKNVPRSKMWEAISDKFLTTLDDGRPVFDTNMRKTYFLQFKRDHGISRFDIMRYKVSRLLEIILSRINNIIVSENIKYRVIFNKLGYYQQKLKYTLREHPLVGQDKCVHDINLYLQWHNYSHIYHHIKDKKILNALEIGAGAGILTMLLHHDLSAKITIVDLPEMISLSSACVNMLLPKARILLPNEVTGTTLIDYEKYDFVFLLPNQSHLIQENHYDLAVNSNSMCEMKKEEIDFYFYLIQRVVRNGGLFYCSNRYRKNPFAMIL